MKVRYSTFCASVVVVVYVYFILMLVVMLVLKLMYFAWLIKPRCMIFRYIYISYVFSSLVNNHEASDVLTVEAKLCQVLCALIAGPAAL